MEKKYTLYANCFMLCTFILFGTTVNTSPYPIRLLVKKSCDDWVTLTYEMYPHVTKISTFEACDVTYWSAHAQNSSIRVLYNYPSTKSDISILSLTKHIGYIVYISCDNKFQSNNVTFTTGRPCRSEDSTEAREVYSTPMILEDRGTTQMSTIDVTLGIFFGMFGVIILAVGALYFWHYYQRRQRIQRVFGQRHRDPFEILHRNMNESSINSL